MKKLHLLKLLLLSFLIGGLFSCELRDDDIMRNLKSDQSQEGMIIVSTGDPGTEMPAELCGEPVIVPLYQFGLGEPSLGNVTVGNDEEYLYVKFEITEKCWEIDQIYLYAGAIDDIPLADPDKPPSYPAFWDFIKLKFDALVVSYTYRILLEKLPECPVILAKVRVVCDEDNKVLWAMGTNPGWDQAAYYFEYCEQDCNGCKPGIYRTQTPGGWGAKPAGNNPGAYLDANFYAAFGDELVVGGPLTITLTSAKAIEILLPTGGKPAALIMNYVDPPKIKNVLVGHVVALSLSVGFDIYDPGFGEADGALTALVIDNGGDFDGWTVQAVLDEANAVLGGGGTHTPSQMTDMLSKINEYFVDGKLSGDYKLFKCV